MKHLMDFTITKPGQLFNYRYQNCVYGNTWLACWIILWLTNRILYRYKKFDEGQKFTIYTIVK
ncbi:MAG: hypothetical protein IPM92_17360 [Saprospiraceae bacterium]|nr:hypothetical protein [Saprospiraceae bacterium]